MCTKVFRKELIAYQFDERYSSCEDMLFVVQNVKKIRYSVYVDSKTYHYRVRKFASSTEWLLSSPKNIKILKAYVGMIETLKEDVSLGMSCDLATSVFLSYYYCFQINRSKLVADSTALEMLSELKPYVNERLRAYCTSPRIGLAAKLKVWIRTKIPQVWVWLSIFKKVRFLKIAASLICKARFSRTSSRMLRINETQ